MHGKRQVETIREWGREFGFDAVGIATAAGDATAGVAAADGLAAWLAAGRHGTMDYMARHGAGRADPATVLPGARSVIMARMNYWPPAADAQATLGDARLAYVSRYALGRDYHKLLRGRLAQLARRIEEAFGPCATRAFTDSAPLMEVEFATRAGLGWRGKHTLLLERDAGSWFFLGGIATDLALPADAPVTDHCGTCTACLDACPTAAFDGPYRLDARRCISYLTIELREAIPEPLRAAMGNRIYGCDDCQLACPWSRFTVPTREPDFAPRHALDAATLVALFGWTAEEFDARLAGSPIRRIGHDAWLRNIAVALGNAPTTDQVLDALRARADDASAQVREHVAWALMRHGALGAVPPPL